MDAICNYILWLNYDKIEFLPVMRTADGPPYDLHDASRYEDCHVEASYFLNILIVCTVYK